MGRVCIFRALVCVFYGSNRALVRGVVGHEACVVPMLVPVSLIGPYPPTMSKYEHVRAEIVGPTRGRRPPSGRPVRPVGLKDVCGEIRNS